MIYYICEGPVRGWCGVRHRTLEACGRHCRADNATMRSLPGGNSYSDRVPVSRSGTGNPSPAADHHCHTYHWDGEEYV